MTRSKTGSVSQRAILRIGEEEGDDLPAVRHVAGGEDGGVVTLAGEVIGLLHLGRSPQATAAVYQPSHPSPLDC